MPQDGQSQSGIINKTNLSLIVVFIILSLLSFNYFLLFHSLVEVFSVIVSFIIFVIAIYTYNNTENNFFIIIGIAYGFVGFFDLLHTLAYKGMNVFVNTGADLPTQLWIITRYIESFAILLALIYLGSKKKCDNKKVIYSLLAVSILLISLLYYDLFPTAFIEGEGLTLFKIISEYIISGILLFSLYLLYKKQEYFEKKIYHLIFVSIAMTIISEIFFTFYVDVYGLSNILGHLFKVLSVILIFKAIIETGFKRPYDLLYKELKTRKDQLSAEKQFIDSIYNNIEQGIAVHELLYNENMEPIDYKIIDANDAYARIMKIPLEKALGSLGSNIYYGKGAPHLDIYTGIVNNGETVQLEEYISSLDKYLSITGTPLKDKQFIILFEDITELKEQEIELKNRAKKVQQLNHELEKLIYLTNRLSIASQLKRDEFLNDVLEIAMALIEHADYGSASINKDDGWQVIATYNCEENLINELNQKRDLIYKSDESIFEVDLVKMNNQKLLKEFKETDYNNELFKYLENLSTKIKESIFFELNSNRNMKIRISLDISANSDTKFNENDEEILRALRNLIYVFLNHNIESKKIKSDSDNQIFID